MERQLAAPAAMAIHAASDGFRWAGRNIGLGAAFTLLRCGFGDAAHNTFGGPVCRFIYALRQGL